MRRVRFRRVQLVAPEFARSWGLELVRPDAPYADAFVSVIRILVIDSSFEFRHSNLTQNLSIENAASKRTLQLQ
jgi:hypothetical protein